MTNYYDIHVRLSDEEGGMHRMIGIVQRRGFDICGMYMPVDDEFIKTVRMTVSPRNEAYKIDVLQRQIERMHNAKEVRVVPVDKKAKREGRGVWRFLGRRPSFLVTGGEAR